MDEILGCDIPASTENFVSDVNQWAEDNHHITERQQSAIQKIAEEHGIDCPDA